MAKFADNPNILDNLPADAASDFPVEKWWEVTVICPLMLEDSVYWVFDELGSKGTASQKKDDQRIVSAYFPQVQFEPAVFEQLKSDVAAQADAMSVDADAVSVDWRLIEEEDWAKSWKVHWQPEEVGDRWLINPAWMDPPVTERTILALDPGSAFGTGAHATTQLCLKGLEKQTLEGQTIADIGCGSGILSIAALLYGAKHAYAADVDPLAMSATQANADANHISPSQLSCEVGSVGEIISMAEADGALPVDGIVCNILAEIIVGLILPQLSELADENTWGLLSGVLTSKSEWVEEHLDARGWQVVEKDHQDEWCSMRICLKSSTGS